ncbi:DegT/DnrJ/EryC1/StrS aminotransferase family protein [Flavobacterium sp. CS20]|uniref:DegT/DnrJ/EryC1/StrS family aminotransferase n=1 Tax=Flavobacterium sp. CS20 TaxID=2775246 RepID=UPI001B3A7697|nr:aminotransferase class I/II-fold pyridoxal phosphate-dependent enzyme [Flavobacterium sp. CS20]QTY26378.1 aminotransferase class I/II-fold pyridoxal phosphate-dependent enzyme [Flavobacterium sp. CS20]
MSQPSKIWLSSPHMGGHEQDFINEAFEANWIAPLGPNVNGFENDLKTYLKTDKQVATLSSGTATIHLALVQLGVSHGDEVICQSFTFCGSINPIVYQGARPILVDSEPNSWNICPKALEEAIKDRIQKRKKPKAIIAVHLYGMPYQVEQVNAIAKQYDIPIIEDAAEALGSTYNNQNCGTFGDFAALSFNGNKIITTSGGGALVCKNQSSKEKTVFYATQARDNAEHYQHTEIGYNYRMSNIVAGIGRGQMQVLDEHIALRREMHQFYKNIFENINSIEVFEKEDNKVFSNYWLSAITINEKANFTREDLRLFLLEDNIESRPLWKPMHLQPVFKDCPYYGTNVAEKLFDRGLCLPSGSNLTDKEKYRIETKLTAFLKYYGHI